MMQQGQAAFNKKDFVTAFKKFKGAKAFLEGDKKRSDEVEVWIEKTFDGIDAQRQEAFENKKKAEENAARAAENERVAKANEQKANDLLKKVEEEKEKTEAALALNKKTIDALYFYKDRFGLAAKEIYGKIKFGFIDKNANIVIEYQYDESLPFDYNGFAKVKRDKANYLIDTLGREYAVAYELKDLSKEITALDLRNKQLSELDSTIFSNTELKILLLSGNQLKTLPKEIAKLKKLISIDLSNNFIYRHEKIWGVEHTMGVVDIFEENTISKEEIEKIKKLLPNCIIYHN